MASDPGDLVLDPTCGSGTTAYVAEQWGRRWITIDTSRVALALARARIMGARYPFLFISSVQKEFAQARRDLKAFLLGDAVLHRFISEALFTHLNLLDGAKPTNAAMLLFGTNPQRFHRTAEVKCISCHGTEYRRPFASLQVYGGDIFAQADQARDFVLGKINRSIGTRAASNIAPATYELPPDAIGEAIINAIAHRDYFSNASVEVRLFADRLEVWNPGRLPGSLTLEELRQDHASIPNNPLVAESLYLTRYIERVGSGTQAMIELLLADSRDGQLKEAEVTRTAPSSQPVHGNIRHGFVYERVPHITLKSIANNAEVDVIWDKWEQRLAPLREKLNEALGTNWQEW